MAPGDRTPCTYTAVMIRSVQGRGQILVLLVMPGLSWVVDYLLFTAEMSKSGSLITILHRKNVNAGVMTLDVDTARKMYPHWPQWESIAKHFTK
jgi:hypothetical protein